MDGAIQFEGYSSRADEKHVPRKTYPVRLISCQYAPPFWALPSTLVRLHILLENRVVDLKSVVSILRPDPGFVAEVLRITGSNGLASSHSLHECLLDLGMDNLRRAAQFIPSLAISSRDEEIGHLRFRFKRARLTAMAAERISMTLGDILPEQAYIAGLLHDLPGLMCWNKECPCKSPETLARLDPWNLPDYVVEAIRWHDRPGYASAEHLPVVRRVAAARAWVDEVELSDAQLPLGWFQAVSNKPTWENLPNRGSVLHELADGLSHWRIALMN